LQQDGGGGGGGNGITSSKNQQEGSTRSTDKTSYRGLSEREEHTCYDE